MWCSRSWSAAYHPVTSAGCRHFAQRLRTGASADQLWSAGRAAPQTTERLLHSVLHLRPSQRQARKRNPVAHRSLALLSPESHGPPHIVRTHQIRKPAADSQGDVDRGGQPALQAAVKSAPMSPDLRRRHGPPVPTYWRRGWHHGETHGVPALVNAQQGSCLRPPAVHEKAFPKPRSRVGAQCRSRADSRHGARPNDQSVPSHSACMLWPLVIT